MHRARQRLIRARDRGWRGDQGFSLLEALVALVLAALVLATLIRAIDLGLGAARRERDMTGAVARAQSHMAEFAGARSLTEGTRSGQDDAVYSWRVSVTRLGVAPPFRRLRLNGGVYALNTALFEVSVRVFWDTGQSVTLVSQFLAPERDGP